MKAKKRFAASGTVGYSIMMVRSDDGKVIAYLVSALVVPQSDFLIRRCGKSVTTVSVRRNVLSPKTVTMVQSYLKHGPTQV